MGVCASSCCGRRRKQRVHDPEREPLLQNAERTGKSLADAFGALRTGKLPSQNQLNRLVQQALGSRQLNDTRHLSERGAQIVDETKAVLQRFLEFGLEKNSDDIIQDILFSIAQLDPEDAVRTGENVMHRAGEQAEGAAHDAKDVVLSLGALLRLALTSAAFRLVASSLVLLLRDAILSTTHQVEELATTVESSAGTVEHLAAGVDKAAHDVEEAVRNDHIADLDVRDAGRAVVEDVQAEIEQNKALPKPPAAVEPQRGTDLSVEDVVITQLQEILKEAQSDPQCFSALLTILGGLQQAAKPWRGPTHDFDLPGTSDSPLLGDTKTFLERLVPQSTLRVLYMSIAGNQREIRRYIRGLRNFLTKVIGDTGYASSKDGQRDMQVLANEGRSLLHSLRGFREVVSALEADKTTRRLSIALHTLFTDVLDYIGTSTPSFSQTASEAASTTGGFAKDLWKDARGYFIPLVLKALWRVQDRGSGGKGVPIPLPRVEFVQGSHRRSTAGADPGSTVRGVVDGRMVFAQARSFTSQGEDEDEEPSVLPSTIHITRSEDTLISLAGPNATVDTESRMHLHLKDILSLQGGGEVRLSGIQYFASYRAWYTDEGILDLILRSSSPSSSASGINVDLILTNTNTTFSISSVTVTIPTSISLRPKFHNSRHWIINKFLIEPFTPLVVRRIAENVLEGFVHKIGERAALARQTGDWMSILTGPPVPPDAPTAEIYASLPGMGVQVVPPDSDAVVTIGAAPQLVPGHAIPDPPAFDGVVERARGEVESVVRETREGVEDGVRQAGEAAGGVRGVYEERVRKETTAQKEGWRSDAFDL